MSLSGLPSTITIPDPDSGTERAVATLSVTGGTGDKTFTFRDEGAEENNLDLVVYFWIDGNNVYRQASHPAWAGSSTFFVRVTDEENEYIEQQFTVIFEYNE